MKKEKKGIKKKKVTRKIKRAFTLLELLAVIIILGLLILIAIPSVTKYISDSRKETYIDTARQYLKGAANLVNSGKFSMYDTSVTYYIPSTCIKLESGGESPYGGKFNPAYIVVTYDNETFNYFWMSRDNQNVGIKSPTSDKRLDTKLIETNVKVEDLRPIYGIDGREFIGVLDSNECTTSGITLTYPEKYATADGPITPAEPTEEDVYYNATLNKYYPTLQSAINAASSNQSLEVIKDIEENSQVIIPSTLKNFKIDFKSYGVNFHYTIQDPIINNGEIIFTNTSSEFNGNGSIGTWSPIINNGTIDIRGNMFLRGENEAIENHGTVNISGGEVIGYDADGMSNYGTINITGGEVDGYTRGVENYGTLNVTGGIVSGRMAIYNAQNATTNFGGNAAIRANETGIGNGGTLVITGGKIVASYPYSTYGIVNSGTATINNANISATTSGSGARSYGIKINSGTVTLNSGTVKASTSSSGYESFAIYNQGTFIMNDGEIIAQTHKSYGLDATGIYLTGNSICTVVSGKINGSEYGIETSGNYTLTIGKKDSTVNSNNPEIEGTSNNGIGIGLANTGTFNFYDGIVKGHRASDKSISGNAATTNYPNGYKLYKTYLNSVATAYLVQDN